MCLYAFLDEWRDIYYESLSEYLARSKDDPIERIFITVHRTDP
jgi:hypothetical protein